MLAFERSEVNTLKALGAITVELASVATDLFDDLVIEHHQRITSIVASAALAIDEARGARRCSGHTGVVGLNTGAVT